MSHTPHGGGYVPPSSSQSPSNHSNAHGGGFVPNSASYRPGVQAHYTQQSQGNYNYSTDTGYGASYQPTPQSNIKRKNVEMGIGVVESSDTEKGYQAMPEMIQSDIYTQRGYRNLQHPRATWKWKFPNSIQMPGLQYSDASTHRHRDIMQRHTHGFEDTDYYLSPYDGHLAKLVVQAAQELYDSEANFTWRRTFIRNASPVPLRITNWAIGSIKEDEEMTGRDWALAAGKWLPAVAALGLLLTFPANLAGEIRNGGFYDPFPYRYWGYPKAARNIYENEPRQIPGLTSSQSVEFVSNKLSDRPIEPRYLCFLGNNDDAAEICLVEEWKRSHGEDSRRDYVFVAYTAEQFNTPDDLNYLHSIGQHAAQAAGVAAYWVGCSCMADPAQLEEDVYRISDVVRGAHSLIIAVGPSKDQLNTEEETQQDMLRGWAGRVWTWPEILLSPGEQPISVYSKNGDLKKPMQIWKRNFAAIAFDDAAVSRQLIDHYTGSLILSPLELVTIALRCLGTRSTHVHLPGDLSYALMGLLRRRPKVDGSDSDFQAFARLSLANDSNLLLERLICLQPRSTFEPWHTMSDAWGAKLWDIYPTCQVSAIAEDNTVILDGAFGAAIRWKSFTPVASLVRDGWRRFFAKIFLRSSPTVLVIASVVLGLRLQYGPAATAIGLILLLIALVQLLLSPYLVRVLYSGKLWFTQPWFFGFEGYLPLEQIEARIFGIHSPSQTRLTWSATGSPLSRHESVDGECIGIDPTRDPEIANIVRKAVHAPYGQERVFTLVDTYTMTVTLFQAVRPPVAVVLCGSEGGMQRAVLCSYEWKKGILWKEAVLRMETTVLEKLSRVARFRIGLKREHVKVMRR